MIPKEMKYNLHYGYYFLDKTKVSIFEEYGAFNVFTKGVC